ncbi:transposase [Streptomyces sp. NPDC006602]|uniref:transposase n=1 Tax=Streptomyces sp. NPDC006602 TaxID=3364751 RepID=UPI0036BC1695
MRRPGIWRAPAGPTVSDERTLLSAFSVDQADAGGGRPPGQRLLGRRVVGCPCRCPQRGDRQRGFVVLPRRWKVERTIGWCMSARRNARDYERLPQHSEAHLNWALITMMTRRLTRKSPRTSQWAKTG